MSCAYSCLHEGYWLDSLPIESLHHLVAVEESHREEQKEIVFHLDYRVYIQKSDMWYTKLGPRHRNDTTENKDRKTKGAL